MFFSYVFLVYMWVDSDLLPLLAFDKSGWTTGDGKQAPAGWAIVVRCSKRDLLEFHKVWLSRVVVIQFCHSSSVFFNPDGSNNWPYAELLKSWVGSGDVISDVISLVPLLSSIFSYSSTSCAFILVSLPRFYNLVIHNKSITHIPSLGSYIKYPSNNNRQKKL